MNQNTKYLIIAVLIFALGYFAPGNHTFVLSRSNNLNLAKGSSDITAKADINDFWKVWNTVDEKYIDSTKINNDNKIYGAIKGMVASIGDPYTVFFPPSESKLFSETIKGEFGGIGAEIGVKDDIVTVIAPLKDSPAYKAGLKSGDKILKINDTSTENMTTEEAVHLIRGKIGTVVSLSIYRVGEKEQQVIKVTRGIIKIPIIDTKSIEDKKTFVISFYSFSENSANLFNDALNKFKASGYKKLIIDLRGNPGGYLDSAVDIAGHFIKDGEKIVSENFGKNGNEIVHRSVKNSNFISDTEILVLVDNGSASASEILAGALQDYKIAKIVGGQTYGKGSVQELLDMGNGTTLKVTVAKWFTPNGNSISEKGITPDVEIKLTDAEKADSYKDPTKDITLDKALNLFSK